MNKALGIGLIAVGIFLIVTGLNASKSFDSEVSRVFTGSPSDKSLWMLVGGIASTLAGAYLGFGRGWKK